MEETETRRNSPLDGRWNPLYWFGDLSADNAVDIAATINRILEGQRHVVASALDGKLERVLTDNRFNYAEVGKTGAITISNTYGLWIISAPAYFRFEGEQVYVSHKSGAGRELQWSFAVQDR